MAFFLVARMERSDIRDSPPRDLAPDFAFAQSGLRTSAQSGEARWAADAVTKRLGCKSRSKSRKRCAGAVSDASRMRTIEKILRTFHGTNGMTASVPAASASATP